MSPGESHAYTRDELLDAGVQAVGEDVRVDRSVRLFGALTLVRTSVPDGVVAFGNPMRTRSRTRDTERLRALERQYLSTVEGPPLP